MFSAEAMESVKADGNIWVIPKDTVLLYYDDLTSAKDSNVTSTMAYSDHPFVISQESTYYTYSTQGNNGKITVTPATGIKLTKTLADGYTNVLYPTCGTLLVGLGLANISLSEWFKKTILFQLLLMAISIGFLMLAPSMISFAGDFWSGIFKALFLSVSAFCNAGFDPLGTATPEFSIIIFCG